MSVDFSKAACQSKTKEKKFGLFDAEDKTPAIIKVDDEASWNATVVNNEAKEVHFTAIDNCIDIFRENGEMENRCDCMLRYDTTLLFVELKNKRDSWQAEGLGQIEATIKRMKDENNDWYSSFTKRKAIVANSKHQSPCFQTVNLEQREYFMRNYKARIQFEAEIIIN